MIQPQFITDSAGKQLAVISIADYNDLLAKSELYDTVNTSVYNIPNDHKEEIKLGQEDIKNGKYKANDDVRTNALRLCTK
ncbi:hypothetical protein RIU05_10335 [Riemerella anatipestifer]|nr:hypothetical protein [Riemerella anatipestifer]